MFLAMLEIKRTLGWKGGEHLPSVYLLVCRASTQRNGHEKERIWVRKNMTCPQLGGVSVRARHVTLPLDVVLAALLGRYSNIAEVESVVPCYL